MAEQQFEYQDFVYQFSKGETWCRLGSGAYSEAGAKLEFWQGYQRYILPEFQKRLDQGWEPIGEVGPAGISIHAYRAAKYSALGWIWNIFWIIMLLGVYLLFIFDLYAEPVEFRVPMRRRKA